jgi:hypothetical protein
MGWRYASKKKEYNQIIGQLKSEKPRLKHLILAMNKQRFYLRRDTELQEERPHDGATTDAKQTSEDTSSDAKEAVYH